MFVIIIIKIIIIIIIIIYAFLSWSKLLTLKAL